VLDRTKFTGRPKLSVVGEKFAGEIVEEAVAIGELLCDVVDELPEADLRVGSGRGLHVVGDRRRVREPQLRKDRERLGDELEIALDGKVSPRPVVT
jgi:hypothetical protein